MSPGLDPQPPAPVAQAAPVDASPAPDRALERMRFALRLQGVVCEQPTLALAAHALAVEVARAYSADRVSIGLRRGGSTRLLASSAEPDPVAGAARVRALEQAMDESIDQASLITVPPPAGSPPRITALHAQYQRIAGGCLCSAPLVDTHHVIGALTLEFPATDRPPGGIEALADTLAAVAPVLALRRAAEAHGIERLRLRWARRASEPGRRRLWGAGIGLAVVALAVVPVADRVGAPARVEGEVQRALVSPVDGFLGAVHARPGDAVRAGQVLAELSREDLELERDRWSASLAQHESAYRNALARGERAQYATSQARAAEAQAELARIEAQISRSQLVAPFDGVLIRGDLTQSLGAPVRRGETLMTVAPVDRYRVIAEVDEHDIARLALGARGTLVLTALPDERIPVIVNRMPPAATSRDGRTFYEAETMPGDAPPALRPGLQGQIRFDGERAPLALAAGRRLLHWARLRLWSLGAWLA